MLRSSFYSIKFQILIAFGLLVLPLVVLSYFFSQSHKFFNVSLNQLIVSEEVSRLLSDVERDVVDLQRNVLIFKETASQSSVNNVDVYYREIGNKIKRLRNLDNMQGYSEQLGAIETHLQEYKTNFDIVVGMRNKRSDLVGRHLSQGNLETLINSAAQRASSMDWKSFENHLLSAHNASLSYIVSYDSSHIDIFKRQLGQARQYLQTSVGEGELRTGINSELDAYERNFSRLVSVTRHYVYLINVVMTGSANEILFNANRLDQLFLGKASTNQQDTRANYINQRFWGNIFSLVGIALAAFVSILFYLRITRPIEHITQIFQELAEGRRVEAIDESHRRDEIGKLASAASVFKAKNEQTTQLLVETERMVREQKMLNEELAAEKRRAERALSIKTDFLANMSHELRTPLNSVIGFTVRLIKQSGSKDPREIKALQAIERNGRHLLTMINDILDLSKIEANKLELKIVRVNLAQLCSEVTTHISPSAEEKGLEVVFAGAEVPEIDTDPARLSQILLNLLSNAVKYTEQGSIRLEVESGYGDRSVTIKVTDTGVGITPEDQKRLFKRFEQFDDNTRFEVGQGTGLGLAIVASVARLLGASVSVSSEYGKGSTFTVRVPVSFLGQPPMAVNQ